MLHSSKVVAAGSWTSYAPLMSHLILTATLPGSDFVPQVVFGTLTEVGLSADLNNVQRTLLLVVEPWTVWTFDCHPAQEGLAWHSTWQSMGLLTRTVPKGSEKVQLVAIIQRGNIGEDTAPTSCITASMDAFAWSTQLLSVAFKNVHPAHLGVCMHFIMQPFPLYTRNVAIGSPVKLLSSRENGTSPGQLLGPEMLLGSNTKEGGVHALSERRKHWSPFFRDHQLQPVFPWQIV